MARGTHIRRRKALFLTDSPFRYGRRRRRDLCMPWSPEEEEEEEEADTHEMVRRRGRKPPAASLRE